jgi:hypothetical protein
VQSLAFYFHAWTQLRSALHLLLKNSLFPQLNATLRDYVVWITVQLGFGQWCPR